MSSNHWDHPEQSSPNSREANTKSIAWSSFASIILAVNKLFRRLLIILIGYKHSINTKYDNLTTCQISINLQSKSHFTVIYECPIAVHSAIWQYPGKQNKYKISKQELIKLVFTTTPYSLYKVTSTYSPTPPHTNLTSKWQTMDPTKIHKFTVNTMLWSVRYYTIRENNSTKFGDCLM